MIHLHISPAVSKIRAYDVAHGYESRLPYVATLDVLHISETVVCLQGLVGKVDRETWDRALDLLRASGVTTVMLERHGRMKTIDIPQPNPSTPNNQEIP